MLPTPLPSPWQLLHQVLVELAGVAKKGCHAHALPRSGQAGGTRGKVSNLASWAERGLYFACVRAKSADQCWQIFNRYFSQQAHLQALTTKLSAGSVGAECFPGGGTTRARAKASACVGYLWRSGVSTWISHRCPVGMLQHVSEIATGAFLPSLVGSHIICDHWVWSFL